ncbi:MAG: DUF4394 domain-containing protein [Verrucomicrobiota bacterium JB022]|nr:DUF4394 domain-containing protein [Verrucomicrobiota bacterium JB022]
MNKFLASLSILGVAAASQAYALWGVSADNSLIKFDASNPSVIQSRTAITGLNDPFASILDFDYNPNDGYFYGVDTGANVYRIRSNGVATQIGSFGPSGYDADMAYDPFFGNFRWVSDFAENAMLELDGSFSFGGDFFYSVDDVNFGNTPSLTGIGIDPDFGEMYMIDPELDVLVQTFDPDGGELFTIGSLGLDITGFSSLVIDDNGNLFAALSVDGFTSGLYSIDLMTGAATWIGEFGEGINAIAVPEPRVYAALAGLLALGLAVIRRRR